MIVEIIQPTTHFEQEDSERVRAYHVEMRAVPMLVSLLAKLPEEKPFQVEGQNSVLRKIDASLLLVLNGLPQWADMAVNVQDRREFPLRLFWFVKSRNELKAGDDLIAKLAQTVTLTGFDHSKVFKFGWGVDPCVRPAVKHYVLEQVLAEALRLLRPLLSICSRGWRSGAAEDVGLDLMQSDTGC